MDGSDRIISKIEAKKDSFYRWAYTCYWWHMGFVTVFNMCSVFVPFGLAALLYIPSQHRNLLNVIVLVVSCVGLTAQVLDRSLRLQERNIRLREGGKKLDDGLLGYEAEQMEITQLLQLYDEATRLHVHEEG